MKLFFTILMSLFFFDNNSSTVFSYNGKSIEVNASIGKKFVGTYKGAQGGYLELHADGTGFYKYDYAFGPCKNTPIPIQWGMIKDAKGSAVRFNRKYGQSYPIFFKSTAGARFRGCKEEVLEDFLLVYKNGTIEVSTSDDWKKQ
ncbi:hypothetical protein [Persicobacter psychrovividus]|uniref:MORN repeat protein n=1 Tax=Persicobacter psychrovividus TaxID=387638 RepID=A0ABM7VDC4_9BACT|nr:hypothetical protein PEPS_12140 [Persicobacter psychrovividus]